jgi:hypothetical protein
MAYINRLKDETNETFEDLNLVKKLDFYINDFSMVGFSNYIRLFEQIML